MFSVIIQYIKVLYLTRRSMARGFKSCVYKGSLYPRAVKWLRKSYDVECVNSIFFGERYRIREKSLVTFTVNEAPAEQEETDA